MNLEKLKDSARKFEQKEDWRRAIEVYLKAIQQIESGAESSPDLSLYNRVGDLYLKTNDTAAAVRSYERAVDLYADQGFFNNAIALCGKILRVNPGRTQTYLKLAQLHARKNVVIEAKRNLIEFLERMNALGQLDQAFQSVKEFADQFSGSQEIRIMLVDLLRASSREEEAREQLEKLAGQIEARGGRRTADRAPSQEADPGATPHPTPRQSGGGLVFLDTGLDLATGGPAAGPDSEPEPAGRPDGIELTEPVAAEPGESEPDADLLIERAPTGVEDLTPVAGLEHPPGGLDLEASEVASEELGLERVAALDLDIQGTTLEGMDDPLLEAGEETGAGEGLLVVEPGDLIVPLGEAASGDPDLEEPADLDLAEPPTAGLPLIEPAPAELVAELESRVAEDPDASEPHRLLGEALLPGDLERGLEELELALEGYQRQEDWSGAAAVADRLVGVAPDNIRYHQKRVELAFRTGERGPLIAAYVALGDALGRMGATDKAAAVYNRVLEHDPGNAHALAALTGLAEPAEDSLAAVPPGPAAPVSPTPPVAPVVRPAAPAAGNAAPAPAAAADNGGFVDLGSMVLEEAGPRDTRMRVDRQEPQGEDEQREFAEILEQFKRGIDENLEVDDYQAHYDLGVAFKEMGLLDEAIAEFQKALRAPEGRLRTSEALGQCFFEMGQYAISETVLRRAVDGIEAGDDAKIGLLYWLGRAAEAQGKEREAIGSYERALAVDIRFMDLGERMHRLTAGRRR